MKKKRNKKYNPEKGLKALSNAYLKNTAALYLTSEQKVTMVNISDGKPIHFGPTGYSCLSDVRRQWSVYLFVLRRRQDGQQRCEVGEMPIHEECFASQLSNTINDNLEKWVMKQGNPIHNLNMGWIALPSQQELTDKDIDRILDQWNPWDYLAQWEAKREGYVE